ncbi:hypothetical protein CKA32_005931 [Geitlerinema sp. FC II]|nr:hypothetical protein CKA32_005931 [Geitlerinema sp. FC II]
MGVHGLHDCLFAEDYVYRSYYERGRTGEGETRGQGETTVPSRGTGDLRYVLGFLHTFLTPPQPSPCQGEGASFPSEWGLFPL